MAKSKKPLGDHSIGYARPPVQHRFQKGQSGNPKGRAKGTPTFLQVVEREAAKLVNVKIGEVVERVSKREAITRRLFDKALQGDMPALRLTVGLLSGIAPPANDDAPTQEPLNEAERGAMKILLERLATKAGGHDG